MPEYFHQCPEINRKITMPVGMECKFCDYVEQGDPQPGVAAPAPYPTPAKSGEATKPRSGVGRKADFDLSVLNKATEERGVIGGAWQNEDGSISIVLNPCVVLTSDKNLMIRLFKRNRP